MRQQPTISTQWSHWACARRRRRLDRLTDRSAVEVLRERLYVPLGHYLQKFAR
jgi:hypothetical protein